MADNINVPVVPEQEPDQSELVVPELVNPYFSIWWTAETVSGVPETVMGWLVAQGWQITAATQIEGITPPTFQYELSQQSMDPQRVLLDLCNSFTVAYNDALKYNEQRYNEVVVDWTEMIASSRVHMEAQVEQQDAALGVYITDLNKYTDEIDALIEANRNGLIQDYSVHADAAVAFLTDLGTTDLARINEAFAATLSTQLQGLTDRGLYSSAVAADFTAKNARDKDEAIAALNDRLMREKLANQHTLYGQRVSLAEFRNQAIVTKMNTYVTRLDGWKTVHADNMKLMAYQLEERNNLLVGLYSFVERREDVAPQWKDMASMIAGLGDAAGGWITPS